MKKIIAGILDTLTLAGLCFFLTLFFTDYSFLGINISNINGPAMGAAFLLALRYFLERESFSHNPVAVIFSHLSAIKGRNLVLILSFLLFAILSAVSIARHLSFASCSFDLGIFDQAIWNTSRGNWLFSSLRGNMNLLGDHFEPVLLLIAPLYLVWPSALALLLLQSALLASAIVPLWLIAREKLQQKPLIFAFVLSLMLSRPLRGVAFSDFHPECFILPLLFWAYYFLLKERKGYFFLTLILLLCCKEDAAFLISGFGIFTAFFQKRARLGVFLFLLGISAWLLETKIIIPYFNPLHQYDYDKRLAFGMPYGEFLKNLARNPALIKEVFFTEEKVAYALKLFGPLGFLSLLSPAHYILIAIPLLKNIMPTSVLFTGWHGITSHYSAGILPFIYISSIYGAGRLLSWWKRKNGALILSFVIILCSLLFYGKTDGHKFAKFLQGAKNNRSLEKISYLKLIPPEASVAANFYLVPHLSHRKYIYEFNPRSKTTYMVEYVVVDLGLLDYLPREDAVNIKPYLHEMVKKGHKQIFASPDQQLLIFYNSNFDESLLGKVF